MLGCKTEKTESGARVVSGPRRKKRGGVDARAFQVKRKLAGAGPERFRVLNYRCFSAYLPTRDIKRPRRDGDGGRDCSAGRIINPRAHSRS